MPPLSSIAPSHSSSIFSKIRSKQPPAMPAVDLVIEDRHTPVPCASWKGSHWASTSNSWKGFHKIRHVFIFGDSYSSTSISLTGPAHEPTDEEPIGVPFPGVTSCEPGLPNWVGHLVTEYSSSTLLVHNFAASGSTVPDVRMQMEAFFLLHAGSVAWTPENSLFITWVGINDLATSAFSDALMTVLFEGQTRLYEAGARNFLFIDVPPVDRAPACTLFSMFDTADDVDREGVRIRAADNIVYWNMVLDKHIKDFSNHYHQGRKEDNVTAMYFSSHSSLTAVLDDPKGHMFDPGDVNKMEGEIWVDHLHPSSRVHDFLARDIGTFLQSVKYR